MKIAIDGYEANVPKRLGSSQVAFELIRHLEKIDKKNEYIILLPDKPLADLPKVRDRWKYKILKPKRLWTKIALPLALYTAKYKPDLIFSPTQYIPQFSPVKRIATIFDLSFLHFPQMFNPTDLWQLSNGTGFSAKNADHIITISNFSKLDIIEQYRVDKGKITVAYPGFNKDLFKLLPSNQKITQVKNKYQIDDSYIIYIGTIQPRKNLIRLMEAVARIKGINLIIVGKMTGEGRKGWMYEDTLKTPIRLGIEKRVKFLGFVPQEELPSLIQGAVAFILPSLWEGFGMPIVEAMACGTPVIASNVSSMPEVVGKAGLLIDPYSLDQIEQATRTITTDRKLHKKYSRLGLLQAKKYSFKKMAKIVLKVFERYNL